MKRKSYLLYGSPREIEQKEEMTNPGKFDFLSINVGGACNHRCIFCWTHNSTYSIRNKIFLTNSELTLLIKAFYELGGDTCVIMSDGEPLFSENFRITKKIVEVTGKLGIKMLLFTNGELLTSQMIKKLTNLNPKISFVISINASNKKTYDKIHGAHGTYDRVMKNLGAWKDFCKKTNKKVKNKILTRFAVHFVATRANLKEIPKMQKLANEKECALIITSPGMSGRALFHEKEIARNREDIKFLQKIEKQYSDTTGPTAKSYRNECSYICSSRNLDFSYGATIHSLGGMVLVCPYYVGLGTENWFEFKEYASKGGKYVTGWLITSVRIASAITDIIFEKFGYNYCLKRHPRYPEIEEFMIKLNKTMKKRTKGFNVTSPRYFERIISTLDKTLKQLSKP